MSLNAIRNILNSHMNSLSPTPTVAWENVPFTPDVDSTHYRVNTLFATTRPAASHKSAMDFESGIYQVDIYSPQNQGSASGGAKADALRTHFYRGLRLTNSDGIVVHIASTPSIVLSAREGAFWRIQVDVPWFSYVPGSTP